MSNVENISKKIIALIKNKNEPFYVKYTTFTGNVVKEFSRDLGYSVYEYFDSDHRGPNRIDTERLFKRLKFGISNNEVRKIVVLVVDEFTRNAKKTVIDSIAEQTGKATGRIFINNILLHDMSSYFTNRLISKIIFNSTLTLAVTVAGARARSIYISRKLNQKSPLLSRKLRAGGDLDLFYFLVDDYLEPFIDAIDLKTKDETSFNQVIKNIIQGLK